MMSVEELELERTDDYEVTGKISLKIAGITMAVESCAPGIRMHLDRSARKFLADDVEPDIKLNVFWRDLRDEIRGERIFDSGGLWKLYREDDNYLFSFTTPYFGDCPYKIACINEDFTSGEIYLHRPYFTDRSVYPLEYPLDELLMLNLLAQGRGVELHSCGVVDGSGAGYLFLGQSGAGKTTMARLWETLDGVEILSDDRIIVRCEDGAFWMYGTPWHGEGELSCALKAPLSQIFFLRQGLQNEVVALSRPDAAARLFSCSFPTFYYPDGIAFTLAFFDELTSLVPCYELTFVPDQSVVEYVRSGSTSEPSASAGGF